MSKQPYTTPIDPNIPTEQELADARIRARKKMADEIALSELGMTDTKVAARKGPTPIADEEQCPITLDLYPGSNRIVIDGQIYLHGHTYTVGKRTYDTLCEIISRGWAHQREIEGKDSNAYRREQNLNAITGLPQPLSPAQQQALSRRLG